jgi:hypothetical protein
MNRFGRLARRAAVTLAVMFLLLGSTACQHGVKQVAWTPLFNGQDLSGWEHVGPGEFVVQEGLLKTVGGMGLLWYTGEPFGDVVIRVVYRNPDGANSGVFIRIPEKPTEPRMPINRGYEVQIDDRADEYHTTGVLYALTRASVRPVLADEWNTMDITLDQDRTAVSLNGVQVTDYREGDPVPPKEETRGGDRGPRPLIGYIGLQNHSDGDTVFFREVSIRPLLKHERN